MRVCKLERQPSIRYAFAGPPDLILTSLAALPAALSNKPAQAADETRLVLA
jgi:hypothetical protein